ncbi:uncharacterized protein PV07_01171 [Cladophialophora immunda]|uniref:Uncharacterized protein n=1 Tax=Cladophialophora immunda TaxID=569365 RepID=A0A0D2CTA8_9EURO|nr:uncharacterized protein PV07_01171 [Cladophialophora immunda]KIW34393.1 hypothetical protein PV07_01171 [Cladophialophora immunda]OQV10272.1 hypothetical protein CLAIMM_14295 [Cladophialophora immunda]
MASTVTPTTQQQRRESRLTLTELLSTSRAVLTHPSPHYHFALNCVWDNPHTFLDPWIDQRVSENNFIGLVGSLIAATGASLLSNPALSDVSWVATAAIYIALLFSIISVVTALHQTIHISTASKFENDAEGKLRRLFVLTEASKTALLDQTPPPPNPTAVAVDKIRREKENRIAFIFGLPQLLLSYSIFALFVGVALLGMNALWHRSGEDHWGDPQKIAVAVVVGIFLTIVAFVLSIISQYHES